MSLVGSLEDLGLVDILQIVNLSRKSGMLMLRSESGDGRIVLRDGLVQGATIKGEAENLRGLLVSQGFVDAQTFDRARDAAGAESLQLDEVLGRECSLPRERLDSLRREHVERLVMRMFGWRSGEFSFEIREDLSADDRELLLPSGLNTQYLAMEATRLGDETTRSLGARDADLDESDSADVAEPVFSGEEIVQAVPRAQRGEAERGSDESEADEERIETTPVDAESRKSDVPVAGRAAGRTEVPVQVARSEPKASEDQRVSARSEPKASEDRTVSVLPGNAARRAAGACHLVAIDADLSSLEWLKATLDGLFRRVHIFQRSEPALERIRQYLARGIVPIVILSDATQDRRGPRAPGFVQRLRALAPGMPILAMRPEHAGGENADGADGVVFRPRSPSADPDRWHLYRGLADRLRSDLEPWLRGDRSITARRRALGALGRLKGVSDRLRDPSTQGEVLSLVLEFAAETFARVAMFMLRDNVAVGMAQRGLPPTGGPGDADMRAIELGPDAMPELFGEVLTQRTALRRALTGPRDRQLATRLGAAAPREAYAAPIESGGCVVALVYADNLPDEKALPDTTAFEIVLHEAGLVLDRAVLERALAERG